jgi:hypothetical protein
MRGFALGSSRLKMQDFQADWRKSQDHCLLDLKMPTTVRSAVPGRTGLAGLAGRTGRTGHVGHAGTPGPQMGPYRQKSVPWKVQGSQGRGQLLSDRALEKPSVGRGQGLLDDLGLQLRQELNSLTSDVYR